MKRHNSTSTPPWAVAERAAREEGVWLARLTSGILAAGWGSFWMALACGLLGAVCAWTVMRRDPRLAPVTVSPVAAVVAPDGAARDDQLIHSLRAELSALRVAHREAEAARVRAEFEGQRDREDRIRAEQERDQERAELARRHEVVTDSAPCPQPALVPQLFARPPVFMPESDPLGAHMFERRLLRLQALAHQLGAAATTVPIASDP